MAMTKCKDCKSQISKKAAACPSCGRPQKRKTNPIISFLALIILGVTGFFIYGAITSIDLSDLQTSTGSEKANLDAQKAKRQTAKKKEFTHATGETFSAGQIVYTITSFEFKDRIQLSGASYKPDSSYLVIDLKITNNDTTIRTVPSFKLKDNKGASHNQGLMAAPGHINPLIESFNPGVTKEGYIAFDVPQDRSYSLEVSSGGVLPDKHLVPLRPQAD